MLRRFFGSKFSGHNKSNYHQRSSNEKQSCTNLSTIYYSIELICCHFDSLSQVIATSKDTIAKTIDFVNLIGSRLKRPGLINMSPNQPAERLPLIPAIILKNDCLTDFTLTK